MVAVLVPRLKNEKFELKKLWAGRRHEAQRTTAAVLKRYVATEPAVAMDLLTSKKSA